jgi:hypothetical protein
MTIPYKPSDNDLLMAAIVLRAFSADAGGAAREQMRGVADWLSSQIENKEYENYKKSVAFWPR